LAPFGIILLITSGCSMQDMAGGSPLPSLGGMGDPYIKSSREDIAREKADQLQAALEVYNKEALAEGRDYFIGPNDVLEISIQSLEQPDELSTFKRTVTKDGTIILPLIDQMSVAGRNTRTIENLIAEAYDSDFLKNPQVTVSVDEYLSAPVVVNGAVGSPGIVFLQHNRSSVLEVLSMVSGLDANAGDELIIVRDPRPDPVPDKGDATAGAPPPDEEQHGIEAPAEAAEVVLPENQEPEATGEPPPRRSFLSRLFGGGDSRSEEAESEVSDENLELPEESAAAEQDSSEQSVEIDEIEVAEKNSKQTIVLDLDRLIERGDTRLNLAIYGGDTITVPPQKTLYVYVIGFVRRPGQVTIPPGSDSVRAIHAIAMAGGLDATARVQKCRLMREGHGTVKVDLRKVVDGRRPPLYMEPGDQLIVGATWLAKVLEFVKIGVTGGATVSPTN